MQILKTVDAFRQARRALPSNATVGLVPTMGVRFFLVHHVSSRHLYLVSLLSTK